MPKARQILAQNGPAGAGREIDPSPVRTTEFRKNARIVVTFVSMPLRFRLPSLIGGVRPDLRGRVYVYPLTSHAQVDGGIGLFEIRSTKISR